ncbi:MAG TPA: carboxylesterase family protein [Steroidobacteraceae bacterium]|nr:carboxylesterase family protein [Steroidobacteraceae bacterium]
MLDETAIVEVAQGRLQGIRRGGVSIFKGVPYGGRVEAGARFLPAPPAGPWSRTRSALSYGAPSLQNNTDYPAWIDSRVGAENCLFLNVWSPDTSGKRAVMVWIHGGGYSSGSGGLPIYDGAALAKRGDVVVVTVNHRLNIFGYLHLAAIDPHYATSGNVGQLDLVLALQWVAKNISALGGDPANVTLFGESGGGAKISALMAMPAAQGLFHKAIIESGSALSVMTPEAAERTARAVLGHFDFVPTKVEKLQSIPAEKLLAGYVQLSSGGPAAGGQRVEFAPVVDGISIPTQTWTPAAPELSRHIPLLVGTNHDETVAFIDQGMFDPPADDAALRIRIKRVAVFAAPLNDRDVDVLIARYRHQWPSASRLDLLVRISTDVGMRGNAILQAARQLAHGAPVFMYEFDWPTPCFGGKWALHGIEIPFVFGNLDYGSAWDGHDTTAGRAAADPHGVRFRLAAQTLGAWAAFARTGNPSHAGLPTWRPYSLDRRETMALGAVSELQADPRRENRLLIENGLHA